MARVIEPDLLASFGPFFAVTTHIQAPERPWRMMSEVVTDPAQLTARIAQVRTALAASGRTNEIELRVAGSVAHLGLTARLVAPALALAVIADPDPVIDLADVFWQSELGGPFPLSLPAALFPPAGRSTSPRVAAGSPGVALGSFLDGPVRDLVTATLRTVSIAPHVLWGNVASALHSAGRMMRAASPEFAARTADVVHEALAHPMLRGEFADQHGRFRRRSCCLIYRVAGPGPIDAGSLCGDCALAS